MTKNYEDLIKTGEFDEPSEFDKLKKYLIEKNYNSSNIFDILNASNYEIRHSKYLAWLLKNSNLYKLFKMQSAPDKKDVKTEYPVGPIGEFKKKGRIDILAVTGNEVWVIENKYGSNEHDNQCQHYKRYVKKCNDFKGKTPKFIFLDLYEPGEEDREKALKGYDCITYYEILEFLESSDFKLNEGINGFQKEVLHQYIEILKSNYDFADEEKKLCLAVLKQDGAMEVLLKRYKYDETSPDDCVTIYKLQAFMWSTCLKKGNELINGIYENLSKELLKPFNSNEKKYKYTDNQYGVYRCVPKNCTDKDLKHLNFGNDIYNPILHIAISNNLLYHGGGNKGINISLELAKGKDGEEQKRKRLYENINKELKTNYSAGGWKTLKQIPLISRDEYFEKIINNEPVDLVNDLIKPNIEKIKELAEIYNNILREYLKQP